MICIYVHAYVHSCKHYFQWKGSDASVFSSSNLYAKKCTIWQSYDLSNYTKGKLSGQMKNKLDLVSSYYLVSSLVP